MQKWVKKIVLPDDQPEITIKEQLIRWHIPRRIRGNFRIERRLLINEDYRSTSHYLHAGDEVTMIYLAKDFQTAESQYVPDSSRRPDIIFENDDLLVVNKFKGVKTHPNSPGETGTMMNFVQAYLQEKSQGEAYMVHRLDGDTTGALIIAKTPIVVPILNDMLHQKQIKRTYLAWVAGVMIEQQGTVSLPIGSDPKHERLRQINGFDALPAVTHWQVIHQIYQNTLVRLELETGRTHQIRIHMKAIGHPLIGDPLYNPDQPYSFGLLLHAAAIQFVLPFETKERSIGAALPQGFPRNLRYD